MAGRRRKTLNPLFILLALCALAVAILRSATAAFLITPFLVLVLVGGIMIGIGMFERRQHNAVRQHLMSKVDEIITSKIQALTGRRAQLIYRDAYGNPLTDRWMKEMNYFVDTYLRSRLNTREQELLQEAREEVVRLITRRTYQQMQEDPVINAFSDRMTPAEFEVFCAEQLRLSGWDAEVTKRSRDQGVDVVAEKAGVRIVLQCKLYSSPAGNAAVQEIVAGRAHERAHFGAVVTNNRFTVPAEQLASTNRVLLLHYRDLVQLDAILNSRAA
jgi:restriction system protein